jgi:arylformamidase
MRLYDITPVISARLAVWPGDTPARREVLLDIDRGDNLTLSTLHGTVHLGAHADAPNHYGCGAAGIDARPLAPYLGRCRVLDVAVGRGERISPRAIPHPVSVPRVLLKTGTYPDPENFNEDFAALSVELVERLHEEGVVLIGIDGPSVDLFDSKDLPAHQAFLRNDMAILEGLVLRDVPAGEYELIALPLKLEGFDASPVRAVLRELA